MSAQTSLNEQLGRAVLGGTVTAELAVQRCLEHIEERDGVTHSFVSVRADEALTEARERDAGPHIGPLHGVPFAVKDIFDTRELPTEFNSPMYRGFQPARDAAAVALLKAAGGVFLGKVTTVELASLGAVPDTRNPYNVEFTPGGSSAGSGAAVGGGEVPLALASQTAGSTIRPAAFCGAAGFKPRIRPSSSAVITPDAIDRTMSALRRSSSREPGVRVTRSEAPRRAAPSARPARPTYSSLRSPAVQACS